MAQADSGKQGPTAFGLSQESSSHKLSASGVGGACVVWVAGLIVASLGNSLVCLDRAALERWSRLFDAPFMAWAAAVSGYYMITNVAQLLRAAQLMRAAPTTPIPNELLSTLALFGWTYHLLLMRWPWLSGQAMPGMRLSIDTGTLSSTWYGMPMAAFLELSAFGLIVTQALMGLIETARRRGLIPQADVPSPLRTLGTTSALGLFALQAYLVVGLSQGRF